MSHGRKPALIDFETRSACPIRSHGSWRYSLDPTTDVLCLAFRLPMWAPGQTALWHPAFPSLGMPEEGQDELYELFAWICDGGLIEAHNAWFERGIWTNICGPRFGWPTIDHRQWRCSAAKCAAHALPRDLQDAGDALDLDIKKRIDKVETGVKVIKEIKLIQKVAKPRKPRKKERETWKKEHGDQPMPALYWESKELFDMLFSYCRQDILAEEAISDAVPDLSPHELEVYLEDQLINERGFGLDREAIQAAQTLLINEQTRLNGEIGILTEGAVTKATQRARLLKWCESQGVRLPDTKAETLDWILGNHQLPEPVDRALNVLRALGRSSTAKYEAMANWICPDDRAHGGLLYHAASTGRWGGKGIQPQNFPKGSIDNWDMDYAWEVLKLGEPWMVETIGGVMEVLAQALRGVIVSRPGQTLYVADYAAIEARVLLWLAGDEAALEIFRRNQDIYCDFAASIYGRPVTKADKEERGMGKVGILGLGYQMGASRFVDTCASYGITIEESFAVEVVGAYREKYYRVKQLWDEQEFRAIQATRNPGYEIPTGHVTWTSNEKYLYCILPSGRRLAYPEPEVRKVMTSWGARREQLTFCGVDSLSHKWGRQHTYGGMLVENITQAVARDLLADAGLRCEASGIYTPVLTVHDELIAEGPPGRDIHEFEEIMATCPKWAYGCPVKAEGFSGDRYRK